MFPSMYLSVLKAVMARREQSQADIARAAGVSRQAVSHWFASERDFQNVHVATLLKLSDSLEIDPAELLEPLPGMDDPVAVRRLATEFCWDRAYPDIYRFLAALADGEPRATARLIESRGIYAAASVLGPRIWDDYAGLRPRLPPVRRAEVDAVWRIHRDLTRS
ncbi:MAG: helix-turn-helix transcriptional regulator [Spirochaetaceae bacterium]|nr:helix-turn-helix transcriptional regulator [Spirochaetaceae bacterium]